MTAFFVTGTDTDVGKTLVATAVVSGLVGAGKSVAVYKPVAAGAEVVGGELRNDDAEALLEAANVPLTYAEVNPYCFAPPIAPHLAADRVGTRINHEHLLDQAAGLEARADLLAVEGAGGWKVPLNDSADIADLVASARWPVLLVVGLRLGCISHTLLTVESVLARGLPLLGWVGSELAPATPELAANVQAIKERVEAPCLGVVPWLASASDPALRVQTSHQVVSYLDLALFQQRIAACV